MKRLLATAAACATIAIAPLNLDARPQRGFHSGPYLALEFGAMQSDFDHDEAANLSVGNDFEPSFGCIFGWNIWDFFSAEFQGRYATNLNKGRREHIASANLYGRYTWITDALTDFKSLRILPFLKGGLSVHIAALPGTPSVGGIKAGFGIGPSVGGGIAFLWHKYVYFGIDLQEDLPFFNDIDQTVGGVPNTLVYKGGLHPSFSAAAIIGVHY